VPVFQLRVSTFQNKDCGYPARIDREVSAVREQESDKSRYMYIYVQRSLFCFTNVKTKYIYSLLISGQKNNDLQKKYN